MKITKINFYEVEVQKVTQWDCCDTVQPVCPYCGYVVEYAGSADKGNLICPKCAKKFMFFREVTPMYITSKRGTMTVPDCEGGCGL